MEKIGMKKIGFATMVADMIHEGHFNFLRAARERCDYLIIGLTTDQRCLTEKRKPMMSYDQRRTILLNCKWVDLVIENTGQTKQEVYQQLHFDVLFTTNEYITKPEFTSFMADFPNVEVVSYPTTSGARTTKQIQQIESDILNALQIVGIGNAGHILLLNRRDSQIVLKPIHVGITEFQAVRTSNCYHMPVPPPRNWRRLDEAKRYPNITGVNSFREMDIQSFIRQKAWNPVTGAIEAYVYAHAKEPAPPVPSFQHTNDERKMPAAMYWLQQRFAGPTLRNWILQHEKEENFRGRLSSLLIRIHDIIFEELIPQGIVHADLHADNICIDDGSESVSFIDWGWCLHGSFHMQADEYQYWQQCLIGSFDWNHLVDSMLFDFGNRAWIELLDQY